MTVSDDDGYAAVIDGYSATLQHLGLLQQKRDQLRTRHLEAERQHLQRIACAYADGTIDTDELAQVYQEFKAVADPGYSHRWNEVVPVSAAQINSVMRQRRYRQPNGPHGTWEGAHPFGSGPTPGAGTPVVYVLFDGTNVPCYVGSTQWFRNRLNRHSAEGKQFTYWRAYPCAGRDAAYALENRLLHEYKPYLNKRAAA